MVQLTPELNERFAQMPNTLEALQREIDEKVSHGGDSYAWPGD